MANRYLSRDYLAAIQQKVAAKLEPWAGAYKLLVAQAEAGLDQAPLSVWQNGRSPYFRQDAVYIPGKDGERNPESNMKSGDMALKLANTTLTLALAWRFTGEKRYADKALELIHTWCLNQNTFMFPTGNVFDSATPGAVYGGDIIVFARLQDFFLACYLLGDYAGWNLPALAGVKRWTRSMVEPHRNVMFYQGTEMYNNWEDARLLFLAKVALFLDDVDLLLAVFDRWRQTIPMKMTDEGELHRETMRTRSMHYTMFALDSMAQIAEIARQHGIDLYDYTVNGRNLKLAVDYAARYLLDMKAWPHQMIEPLDDQHMGVFEMAGGVWKDARYGRILEMHAHVPIAHTTLLFGGL